MSAAAILAAMALQGCVGDKPVVNAAAQRQLQSLQLFNADTSPRFTFYLACTSDTVNCVNVRNWFEQWATDRHVTLRGAEPTDPSFQDGQPSRAREQALPYRLAVYYQPWMKPSYTVTTLTKNGGSYPPLLGYTATIYVFDSATGKLLQAMPARAEKSADKRKGVANPYLHEQVDSFLASLDPAYANP
ncbi:hypothetical protein ACXU4B_15570 [Dyella soli]|uniref:DUF4136 domain-containing protein n=1 Tax=Dyella soli TaxID=522319 RepID=A0A4R0YQU2_9GAMM|nr:hypothetical protein [Dyella soli]TCI08940.1 hypothetical protein EZM97_22105 [Dyella soli]